MRNLHGLGQLGVRLGICFAILLAILAMVPSTPSRAAEAGCDPDKMASKYPSLAGKTIKIGQDGESVPFSQRDPKDFSKLIGLDADLARAAFACVGVPIDFTIGTWAGLIPRGDGRPDRHHVGHPALHAPNAPRSSTSWST